MGSETLLSRRQTQRVPTAIREGRNADFLHLPDLVTRPRQNPLAGLRQAQSGRCDGA